MKKLLKLLPFVIGGLVGWFWIAPLFASYTRHLPLGTVLSIGGLSLFALALGYILHIILHEVGHLIGGTLSGYRFISFRVFNQMLVLEKEKLVRKKYTVVGTLGQCLMSPPEMKNGTFPFVLYNLGGGLMNLLLSALCFWLFWLLSGPWYVLFLVGAILGVFMGLTNLFPMRIGGLPNDGYNVLQLSKNATTRHAFWVALNVNAMMASGSQARDIPPAWFDWIDTDRLSDINDPLTLTIAILRYNYLLDRLELTEARAYLETLLDSGMPLIELQKNELRCERLFFELINECRPEEVGRLYSKDLEAYIKATSIYLSRQRLLYAYARLFTKDDEAAARHLALFQKAVETSASLGEIPGEQELVALVDRIAGGGNPQSGFA